MAVLKSDDKQVYIAEGQPILKACQELGVPFGCTNGICGTCTTVVKSGIEHLGKLNDKEKAMGLAENERLMCQCKIYGGEVHLDVF